MTAPNRPVSRARVLAGALALLVVLGGVVSLTELLRHPPDVGAATVEADSGDLRDPVVCPGRREDGDGGGLEAADEPIRVASEDLHDCPATYAARRVTYEGEAVGAVLTRDDGVWVQLNDDVYAGDLGPLPSHRDFRGGNAGLGVFLPDSIATRIHNVGGPDRRGDIVTVTGTFHRVDPASNEVAVIRADAATIRTLGGPIDHPPLADRRLAGIVLALAAVAASLAHRHASRR